MRDDIGKLNMPRSAKAYARRKGLATLLPGAGQKQYVKMAADLVNHGQTKGFASKDAEVKEASERIVDRLIRG